MSEKLKALIKNDQLFYSLLVILVGIIAFGLGRISIKTDTPTPTPTIKVQEQRAVVRERINQNAAEPTNTTSEMLVASKSGTKYHLSSCPGAKQIKDSNRIVFTSATEAEASGYKPAANCPGLQ